jgi:elongation factor 2
MAKELSETIQELMKKPANIRNMGTVAHIDHGKTTFSDSLLAGAGMISMEKAGTQLEMDFDKQEQERGITIFAANASMVHEFDDQKYLINLIDTPGHVDFGGDVTRAMRAVDGVVLLVDCVEMVMPQTETVLRQALKDRVKPVLFINKIDRLIKELKLTPEEMQERLKKIVTNVNILIQKYVEPQYKEKWIVDVANGSVAFGSALKKWAISVPYMKKIGISFKDIIDMTMQEKSEELAKKAPLHRIVLDMVIRHLPNPMDAQNYRIPKIWPGEPEIKIGQDMRGCNPNGKLAAVVTKMYPDPHAGFVATVRIFSGNVKQGQEVYLIGRGHSEKVQQVSVYRGKNRIPMNEVLAGNIVGIVGLKDAFSGETICDPDNIIPSFEAISHLFEPVVTKAIEPKHPRDLAKLIDILKIIAKEDPTLKVKINEDTGEYLVSGLGELHLDAKVERKIREQGIEIGSSPPIVIYKESARDITPQAVEAKSPNRHNRFYIVAQKLEPEVYQAMVEGKIQSDYEIKKKDVELQNKLADLGFGRDQSRNIKLIYNRNMFLDMTKGVTAILEIMEMAKQSFVEAMNEGPLAREPCTGMKIMLVDAKLHEDAIHRGPAQVIPAMRRGIKEAMVHAGAFLVEPKQLIRIDVPNELLGSATKEISNRRGQILEMTEERGVTSIQTKIPVAEMFGFNSSLKSATGGRGFYWMVDIVYEPLPRELEARVVAGIKQRKGITEERPEEEEE